MNSKLFLSAAILLTCFVSSGLAQPPAETPKGYLLGPGDEVTGKVLNEKEYDFVATVSDDGTIDVPFASKPIMARCRTEREIRADVIAELSKQIKSPQLSFRVTAKNSRAVASIAGEVRQPSRIELMRPVTLAEVIAFSGGPLEEASGVVEVRRNHAPLCPVPGVTDDQQPGTVKTYMLSRIGQEGHNPIIHPGDTIWVQRAPVAYISGEVGRPDGIRLKEGSTTLMDAIAMVGGVSRDAKTKDIKIYRNKPEAKSVEDLEIISANYDLIRKGKQPNIEIKAGDVIVVDKAKESLVATLAKFALGAGRSAVLAGASQVPIRVMY
jgi:polysaccharide biosynthesis/export protein